MGVFSMWLLKLTLGWVALAVSGYPRKVCLGFGKGRIVSLSRETQFYIKKVKQICGWQMDRSFKKEEPTASTLYSVCAEIMAYNLEM